MRTGWPAPGHCRSPAAWPRQLFRLAGAPFAVAPEKFTVDRFGIAEMPRFVPISSGVSSTHSALPIVDG